MKLRMGMVGGGLDAMAGELHRRACALDGRVDFVAGALSSTPERSQAAAKAWGLARGYATWQEMLEGSAPATKSTRPSSAQARRCNSPAMASSPPPTMPILSFIAGRLPSATV